ncbi:lipoprotein-releasing ABC transporter permease subunit [Pikeienuella sp. HZG-20]|uniref:lipoprotein-releasing ABC transporter permease subunit n=1 Tax=Paludibacillus litoralis TaxID=3133267 RepID=UPI0030EEDF9A
MARSGGTRPFAGFEWLIAFRYLRARRKERAISAITGFSLAGIVLGVGTLIVVMSVMNGFRDELVSRILGANGHVLVLPARAPDLTDYAALAARAAATPGVVRAAPIVEGQVMASSGRGSAGVLVRGESIENARTLEALVHPESSVGDLADFGPGGVAIGAGVADALGVGVGDMVKLISPKGLRTVLGPAPATVRSFRVAYIFRIGMSEYDKILVYMPLDEAQKFFLKAGAADMIEVMVDRPAEIEKAAERLSRALGPDVRLWTWKDQNGGYLKALQTERVVMFLILSLIILVAALNIISGLIMLVKDKGPDIGVLRTIGLTRGAVMRVFFICGAAIGVVGALLGVVLGVLFTLNIRSIQVAVEWALGVSVWDSSVRYLTEIPAQLHADDVVSVLALALGLSFIATLYPAWRAARLDPVEALRHE